MMVSWSLVVSTAIAAATTAVESQTSATSADNPAIRADDRTVVQALIDRQLFDIAQHLCSARLQSQVPGSPGQSAWTIELIKVQTARAYTSDSTSRAENWERAFEVARRFIQDQASHPQLILVRLQGALAQLGQAQQIRQEVLVQIRDASDAAYAVAILEAASLELRSIERQIDAIIPAAPDQPQSDGRLSKSELQNLKINVALQLARGNIDRALLLPVERSFDRVDVLRQAKQQLESVSRATNPDQPLWWEVQLELVKILRLQNELNSAAESLHALQENDLPPEIGSLLDEEKLQLLIAAGNLGAIEARLRAVPIEKRRPASLDLLLTQAAIKLVQGSRESDRQFWQQFAVGMAQRIELHHGVYWARQANLLLTKALGSEVIQPSDAQILLRVATEAENKQQWDDALQAYEKAADTFQRLGNSDQTARILYRTGLILQHEKRHKSAYQRFQQVTNEFPDHETAAYASINGIWNYARAFSGNFDRDPIYRQWLDRHIETWPNHDSVGQSLIWRALAYMAEQDFLSAYSDLMSIDGDMSQIQNALNLAADSLDQANRTLAAEPDKQREFLFSLAGWLESLIADEPYQIPELWNAVKGQATILLAQINLRYLSDSEVWTSQLLRAILEDSDVYDEAQKSLASALLVAALVSQPNTDEEIQRRVSDMHDPAAGREAAKTLAAALNRSSDATKRQLIAERLVRLIGSIEDKLEKAKQSQNNDWTFAKALALQLNGQHEQAVSTLQQLATEQPQSLEAQIAYAEILATSPTEANWPLALKQWRTIAAKTKPGTTSWFRAKYHVAELLLRTGQRDEALKFLEYMAVIPPGWNESEFKAEFDQLLREAKNKR